MMDEDTRRGCEGVSQGSTPLSRFRPCLRVSSDGLDYITAFCSNDLTITILRVRVRVRMSFQYRFQASHDAFRLLLRQSHQASLESIYLH